MPTLQDTPNGWQSRCVTFKTALKTRLSLYPWTIPRVFTRCLYAGHSDAFQFQLCSADQWGL